MHCYLLTVAYIFNQHKHRLGNGLLFLLILVLLAGCRQEQPHTAASSTFTDDLGRSVVLPDSIRRVVTLSPNLTEIVHTAGAGRRLAGANAADDYPPAVDTLPRFSVLPVDFEAVAALRPDLVLATDQTNNPRDAKTFRALNIPTVFFSFNEVQDIFDAVRRTGRLLGTEKRARAAADSLQHVLQAVKKKTAAAGERPSVLLLAGDKTLYSFGQQSYVHDLIRMAGGRSVTATLDAKAPVLSEEYVIRKNPDVIIGTFGQGTNPQHLLELHPAWKSVSAIEEGRVYSIDGDLVVRPGPRVVAGLRRMAALLHPEMDFSPAAGSTSA